MELKLEKEIPPTENPENDEGSSDQRVTKFKKDLRERMDKIKKPNLGSKEYQKHVCIMLIVLAVMIFPVYIFLLVWTIRNGNENKGTVMMINTCWDDFIEFGDQPQQIHHYFAKNGHSLSNDQVSFRTFNIKGINISDLSRIISRIGYFESSDYKFEEKKITAKHYYFRYPRVHPKIFLSQLEVDLFPDDVQKIIRNAVSQIDLSKRLTSDFFASGIHWKRTSEEYYKLLEYSEYAAWIYAFGFHVSHFSVNVNKLENFTSIEEVNEFLKNGDFEINSFTDESGNRIEIMGSKNTLEQFSTVAAMKEITFDDGVVVNIPCSFYGFVKRYEIPSDEEEEGVFFSGFLEENENKIFDSTNLKIRN